MKTMRILMLGAGLAWLAQANAALACQACTGQSDSPMAQGMNAGIFALLGVVGLMLSAAATFFIFLARRSATVAKTERNSTH